MEHFSMWLWLIVLFICLLPIVSIKLASDDKTMNRGAFGIRTILMVLIGIIVAVIPGDANIVISLAITAAALVYDFFMTVWAVHRLNEIGWSRWWAYLIWFPLLNLAMLLILCFKKSKQAALTA